MAAIESAADRAAPLSTTIPGLGGVTLLLHDNDIAAPGIRYTVDGRDVVAPSIRTLAGRVVGAAESDVRLTLTRAGLGGYVAAHGKRIWLEPHPSDPSKVVAYPGSGSTIDFGDDGVAIPTRANATHSGQVNFLGVGSCVINSCGELTAHVILDADAAFNNLGADCFGRQMTVLNAVDGIYRATATRIRLSVVQQNCRTSSFGTAGAVPMLEALRAAWSGTGTDRSLVFLLTGVDLTGTTVGVAYIGGVCGRIDPSPPLVAQRCSYGYGLGQNVGSVASLDLRVKVAAHEIGHTFNAEHDDAGCNGSGRLMCSSIQGSGPQAFSTSSANQIRSHAEETIGYLASL